MINAWTKSNQDREIDQQKDLRADKLANPKQMKRCPSQEKMRSFKKEKKIEIGK